MLEQCGIEPTPGAELLCHLADPADATHRFLVTLVHRDGTEKLIDLLTAGDGFADVATAIRRGFDRAWSIYESLLIWETAF
jgi:hypothetical protein